MCWDALDVSMSQVQALRSSLARCAHALRDDAPIELFGLDVSPWIVEELVHLVDEDALKFLLLRHVVERGVTLTRPAVLLYRDEFYVTGRAISSARVGETRKWAMQRGLISDDHWP